jgi:putative transcriptional regulator
MIARLRGARSMLDPRHVAGFRRGLSENGGVRIDNATGKLLVATPRTGGEVFRRSVVLVLQHVEDGAQGIVLNHPLNAPVSAVLPPWQDYVTDPPNVFQGGPVALDSALGLVIVPGDHQEPMGVRLLFGGLGLVDLDVPPLVVMPSVAGLRIFAGYAGWSDGQLEQEIRDGGWYVVESEARDAFTSEPETLWSAVLRRQRGNLALVASLPEDPTMN